MPWRGRAAHPDRQKSWQDSDRCRDQICNHDPQATLEAQDRARCTHPHTAKETVGGNSHAGRAGIPHKTWVHATMPILDPERLPESVVGSWPGGSRLTYY